jgi:hypothetical protein
MFTHLLAVDCRQAIVNHGAFQNHAHLHVKLTFQSRLAFAAAHHSAADKSTQFKKLYRSCKNSKKTV